MYKSVAALAAFAATALAHGTTQGVTIDGVYTTGWKGDYYYALQNKQALPAHIGWYAENLDNGFVEPNAFNTTDIICHKNAKSEYSSDSLAKVAAGGTIDFHWTAWPESHVGPVITYIAPYSGDIASVDKATLKWSKIDAGGYDNGQWAAVKMIAQNNTWPVTVPQTLKAGKYVFRHEIIALHGAGSVNGAQNYPQCLNIEVTGSGTAVPEGVLGVDLYTPTEDGIVFNPYAATIKYNIPGPALWDGASSGGSSPTTPTTPTTSAAASASASPVASSSAAPIASASATATAVAEASPVASAVATPTGGASGETTPQTFTIETFIAWLEEKTASNAKARRHARSFFL